MQSPRRQRSSSRCSGAVAYGLSLFLVALHLGGLAHLALERHGVCWEHGTVTELGASTGPVSPSPRETAPGLHAGTASGLEDADGHHHCPVQASRRNWGGPPSVALFALAAGPALTAVPTCTSSPRADSALLRRAPKQSPPLPA